MDLSSYLVGRRYPTREIILLEFDLRSVPVTTSHLTEHLIDSSIVNQRPEGSGAIARPDSMAPRMSSCAMLLTVICLPAPHPLLCHWPAQPFDFSGQSFC